MKSIFSTLKQINESYDQMRSRYVTEYEQAEETLINRILKTAAERLDEELKNLKPDKINPGDVKTELKIDFTKWKERKNYTKFIQPNEAALQDALDKTEEKYLLSGIVRLYTWSDDMGRYYFTAYVKITDKEMLIKHGVYKS
jgi:hypothetical protein